MKLDGGQALIRSLELEGVEVMFGLPGGAILPVYDPIIDSSIRHILVRHEQGAGHMAEGYAHATGRPGVAMVTSGPAATNIVTPLCDAYLDSVPMVVITGQVPTGAIGTDAFQECDTTGMTSGITKHNFLVTDAQDIPRTIKEAFHIATTGRPGPVLVDIPKDIVDPDNPNSAMEWSDNVEMDLPGYHPDTSVEPAAIQAAVALMQAAERPVLYVGGGILKARAAEALRELAELTGFHVVTTLMARGAFPDSHELCLGMPGMHGNFTAVTAMQESDLLIALGSRFDDRITGRLDGFAVDAKIIHVDIDPAELGKVRRPDVAIQGDCRVAIEAMVELLRVQGVGESDRQAWRSRISGWQERFPLTYDPSVPGEALKPQFVIEKLRDATPDDTIVASGVGQHQMWASQYWKFDHPYTWINSGGLGTMGFSIPAAIGAKVGCPDKTVWAIDGDGCFQMTAQELVTATVENIPIKVALLNNSYLGMVRQWQDMFYDERHSEVFLSKDVPDYKGWAEAMGCFALRVDDPDEVENAIAQANEVNDRPVVIDFRTEAREKVYPMVAAGTTNSDLLVHPSQEDQPR
ncbi:MAG: biosynthetic-type acetolactate synthase large subunit [Actinobacteria bacterium]|jgi:acetolactate synthase-1/2/3 large subunit|nr:biosynthetic-type acetolactate synthase large subunit [Actinomycetota bacterium]MBT3746494.1 biosynthetic-type acetolactate synthase large subunit [Actinomycetota bacterium]MBT4009360.1 biosynthetic-type acetolactate synthase large subunit [Actinomycetota bacterium]MBT4303577.1 biosynthetic-type acetolactate synthase large subunit [Actinomycetota bacterium]MBT4476372.1 biosynthetic-type acetolactate synthase large subunit [Actinomycetota bacterium]